MLTARSIVPALLGATWRALSHTPVVVAACCLLLGPLALMIDLPVAQFCLADRVPGDLQRVLVWSELAAHGLGIALITLLLYVLDPGRRAYLPRLLAMGYGAGLTADLLKPIMARVRPRHFDFEGGILDSFAGWLPFLFPVEGYRLFDSEWMSLPSGHTAVAVAFAFGLARMYPHGSRLFAGLAVLAALQRIECGAHFVSDTLAGAAVGALVAFIMTESVLINRWFTRVESHLRKPEA